MSLTPKEWLDANNRFQNENNQANKEKLEAADAATKEGNSCDILDFCFDVMYYKNLL